MIEPSRNASWLKAIADAAESRSTALPPFEHQAMGTARTRATADGRFVTFKRRLVPASRAALDGIEWTLWREANDLPVPVAAFRESTEPQADRVAVAFSLLHGWLMDGWTSVQAQAEVAKHPRAQSLDTFPPPPAESSQ